MHAPDEFRSLAEVLREEQLLAAPTTVAIEYSAEDAATDRIGEVAAARDVRLFRARVEDAVESTIAALCCDIAAEVVGRELQLAPASIAEVVGRALQRFHAECPVRVRVHPEDLRSLAADVIPAVADGELRRGDAILEVGAGSLDVTLGVRLDAVLRAYR